MTAGGLSTSANDSACTGASDGAMASDDDVVQVNPSHSEVWGHKPVLKGWAPTVVRLYRSGAITAGFATAI
jgi:hypothetical protein